MLCFVTGNKTFAQFSEESITRRWEKLPDGGQILRLWTEKDLDAKEPQIAILRLTEAQSRTFKSETKAYLMRNKVFGDLKLGRIISFADISETKSATRKSKPGSVDPIFVVEHNPYCDSAIIQFDMP